MLFDILALTSLLFIIFITRRIADFLPAVIKCMLWWKENVNIDVSLKTRRDRNLVAGSLVLPFCLMATRFRLFSPEFMNNIQETAALGITIGVFLCYFLLREGIAAGLRPRRINSSIWHAATTSEYTFFIPLTLILLITGGVMTLTNASSDSIKVAMFCISGAIYMAFLVRKFQIFTSKCNLFSAFLYLCALEILPTGVLITSAVIFRYFSSKL